MARLYLEWSLERLTGTNAGVLARRPIMKEALVGGDSIHEGSDRPDGRVRGARGAGRLLSACANKRVGYVTKNDARAVQSPLSLSSINSRQPFGASSYWPMWKHTIETSPPCSKSRSIMQSAGCDPLDSLISLEFDLASRVVEDHEVRMAMTVYEPGRDHLATDVDRLQPFLTHPPRRLSCRL